MNFKERLIGILIFLISLVLLIIYLYAVTIGKNIMFGEWKLWELAVMVPVAIATLLVFVVGIFIGWSMFKTETQIPEENFEVEEEGEIEVLEGDEENQVDEGEGSGEKTQADNA